MTARRLGAMGRGLGTTALAAVVATGAVGWSSGSVSAAVSQAMPVAVEDELGYDVFLATPTKDGQFFHYSCEFDASWVILKFFGYDVPFEEQLAIVGHDRAVEPTYQQTPEGVVVYGGDITSAFSGDFDTNFLARTTGEAMAPLFEEFGLEVEPVQTREGIEAALDAGAPIWIKATVDFLPWEPVTWITPEGEEIETVLGNDHSVVVVGYDDEAVVIRDVLGPTSSNWERPDQYEVPWQTFMEVWGAQQYDGLAVAPDDDDGAEPRTVEEPRIDPFDIPG